MTQNLIVALMLIHQYVNGVEIIGVENGDLKNFDGRESKVFRSKERYTTLRPT